MRTTPIRIAFAVLALAFFAAPVALRAVGVTAEAFENRRFAEAPKLSDGWDAFQQTGAFLTDRMPLRAQAVRANARIWQDVFGTEPRYGGGTSLPGDQGLSFAGEVEGDAGDGAPAVSPVLAGDDGWLFLQAQFDRACTPPVPHARAVARWRGLVSAVRATGVRAVAVVAPDKGTVYPEHLPDEYPGDDCAPAGRRAVEAALADAAPDVVGLHGRLEAAKREHGDAVYAVKDTHWTTLGSVALVDAVLERLQTDVRVRPGDLVRIEDQRYTGDLTTILGAPEVGALPTATIERTPGAPVVPGRTLIVGDSFSNQALAHLGEYFADVRRVMWESQPAAEIAAEVAAADTVILETAERELAVRAADGGSAEALRAELAAKEPTR